MVCFCDYSPLKWALFDTGLYIHGISPLKLKGFNYGFGIKTNSKVNNSSQLLHTSAANKTANKFNNCICAGQGFGGHGGRARGPHLRAGGGPHTARGTAGNESRVTPLYSSCAKIGPPPENTAVRATALNASVNWVR